MVLFESAFRRCVISIILVSFLRVENSEVVLTLCYQKKNNVF
jgi:hypothetical protein